MSVTANNSIFSQQVVSKSITVLVITYLKLTELIVPTSCDRVNSVLSFTAKVIHVVINDLDFTWEFGDGTPAVTNKGDPKVQHTYKLGGHFNLKVTVKSAAKSVQGSKTICIEEPITKITLTPNVNVVGVLTNQPGTVAVVVAVIPVSSNQKFTWTFNGVSETGSPVKEKHFRFTIAGKYSISLKVENTIYTLTQTFVVEAQIIITGAKLQSDLIENKYVKTSTDVAFSLTTTTGSSAMYSWVFGDGDTLDKVMKSSLTHAYKVSGTYTTKVNASNLVSYEVVTLEISVQDAVSGAKLVCNPTPVDINQSVRCTASAATGTELSYGWKACTSCQRFVSKSSTFDHKYTIKGSYTVTVTILNKVSQVTVTVEVKVFVKIAMLKIVTSVGSYVAKDSTIELEAVCSKGSDLTYRWSIQHKKTGSSTKYTAKTVRHTFSAIGEYKIEVQVTNALGKADASKSVFVQEKVAGLEVEKAKAYAEVYESIRFTVKITSGSDISYEWDFGDGAKVTVVKTTVDHKYTSHGIFQTILTAKNFVSSVKKTVSVGIEDKVSSIGMTGCCSKVLASGVSTIISATVLKGSNLVYTWTVSGGAARTRTFTGKNISLSITTNGSFKCKLEVNNHISSLAVEKTVTVQTTIDKVQLVLQQNKEKLFVKQMVNIDVTTGQGSDIKFNWTVNGVHDSLTGSSMNRVFNTQGVYRIKVSVYNDVSSSTAHIELTIHKILCQIPKLSKIPQSKIETIRSQEFDLELDTDTGGCTVYTVKYLWTVYVSDSCSSLNTKSPVKLSSGDKITNSVLHVSSRTLSAGLYCIVVKVSYADTPVDSTAKFEVEVKTSPLRAVIEGGAERLHGDIPTLLVESGSYDPDTIPPGRTGLRYKWTCAPVKSTVSPTIS
jgi:hypothetical protein